MCISVCKYLGTPEPEDRMKAEALDRGVCDGAKRGSHWRCSCEGAFQNGDHPFILAQIHT